MNSFMYMENEKKILISDEKTIVAWENVEKSVADKAAEMYRKSESIDNFLIYNNCKIYKLVQ